MNLPESHPDDRQIAYNGPVPDDTTTTTTDARSRVTPDWPTCSHDEGRCIGRRIDGHEQCLAHLPAEELDGWLQTVEPGADVDLRGTDLTGELLDRLLAGMAEKYNSHTVHIRIGSTDLRHCRILAPARFKNVRFTGDAQFDGATFAGDAQFGHTTFTGRAAFTGAIFANHAYFNSAKFADSVDFSDATFGGLAQFSYTKFTGRAAFDGVTFDGDAQFDRATFADDAWFHRAAFAYDAWFSHVKFNGDAWFSGATFIGETQFDAADFTRIAGFPRVRFGASISFGPVVADVALFDEASFAKHVVLEVEAGVLSAYSARFDDGVELRVRHARVWLRRTFFGAVSSMSGTAAPFVIRTGRATAKSAAGLGTMDVTAGSERAHRWMVAAGRDPIPGKRRGSGESEVWVPLLLSLEETDVSQLTLIETDLKWCRFSGAHQLDKLRLEGRSPFHRPPAGWRAGRAWPPVWRWAARQVLAEEHPWRASHRKSAGWNTALPSSNYPVEPVTSPPPDARQTPVTGPERLAVLYRSLRKALEDAKNEPGAGDFYYGEMDARRHSPSTGAGERLVLVVYWLLSGYGQRAGRALAALVLLVGVLFTGLTYYGLPDTSTPAAPLTGTVRTSTGQPQQVTIETTAPAKLPPPDRRWTAERMDKAARIALGSVVFRDTDQKLTAAGSWILMAGRAFGPLLLALAALAIRARVKR